MFLRRFFRTDIRISVTGYARLLYKKTWWLCLALWDGVTVRQSLSLARLHLGGDRLGLPAWFAPSVLGCFVRISPIAGTYTSQGELASGRSPVPTGRPQGGRGADLLIWGAPALFSVRLLVWARFHVDSDCWYLVSWG